MTEQEQRTWTIYRRSDAGPGEATEGVQGPNTEQEWIEVVPLARAEKAESRVQELEGERDLALAKADEAERGRRSAVQFQADRISDLQAAESRLARLEEALGDLISLNDEMVKRGVESDRVDAATERARSLLTHSSR